jgi:hypothetical protein
MAGIASKDGVASTLLSRPSRLLDVGCPDKPGHDGGFQKIMLKQRDEIVTRSNLIAT